MNLMLFKFLELFGFYYISNQDLAPDAPEGSQSSSIFTAGPCLPSTSPCGRAGGQL